jgi:hypothetical protein
MAPTDLRATITTLGLSHVAGIMPNTFCVWALGKGPLSAMTWSQGRPPKLITPGRHTSAEFDQALARSLPPRASRTIEWREGTAERFSRGSPVCWSRRLAVITVSVGFYHGWHQNGDAAIFFQ